MSEAIIARRGGIPLADTGGNGSTPTDIPIDVIITSNGTYTCPRTGYYLVQCIGGGGSGGLGDEFNGSFASSNAMVSLPDGRYTTEGETEIRGTTSYSVCHMFGGGGGGSGYINTGIIQLNQNQSVSVTIGVGGNARRSTYTGGTTSFGTYLYASGGTVANDTVVKPSDGDTDGFYLEFFESPSYTVGGNLAIEFASYVWSGSTYLRGGTGYDNGSSGEYSFLYDGGGTVIGRESNRAIGGSGGYIKIDSNNITEALGNHTGGSISNYGRGGYGNEIRKYSSPTNVSGFPGAIIVKWHSNA